MKAKTTAFSCSWLVIAFASTFERPIPRFAFFALGVAIWALLMGILWEQGSKS